MSRGPRSGIAEVLNPLPPQIGPAHTRRIPSGVEVIGPERNVRIRLPRDCDAYTFLKKVFANSRIDLHTRMAAAVACLPYERPRLFAVTPASTNANETRLIIHGGLPAMPGTSIRFPCGSPPPLCPSQFVPAPVEVGTCVADPAPPPTAGGDF
jgi:hypothetical protein